MAQTQPLVCHLPGLELRISALETGPVLRVYDLMSTPAVTSSPQDTLRTLVDEAILRCCCSFVPVVEEDSILGYISTEIIRRIDPEHWPTTRVGDVFARSDATNTVAHDLAIMDLLRCIPETRRRKFLVEEAGRMAGILTLSDLVDQLSAATSAKAP